MRNLTACDLGRPFISLDDLQDFLFVTDTGYGNFFLSSDFCGIKRLVRKKDRAVVDSNRSVNLPFYEYKENPLYLSSEEKRYKRSSNVSDRRPVIVPGWRADLHPVRRFVCFMVGL